jgi:methyltransferase (TIGR00027 family)
MENRASRTAQFMALFRALESVRPRRRRLFTDPFARAFLDPTFAALVGVSRLPPVGAAVTRFIDRRWPGARSSGVARTRLIDDAVAAAVRDGITQLVILGAGFDCRAYRMPDLARARVFEVDHPRTQAVKKERLAALLGTFPPHVVFAGLDLNVEQLAPGLRAGGLSSTQPAFVIWEGVTNYLTASAVQATLRDLAATLAPGSRVLFTYVHRGVLDSSVEFYGAGAAIAAVERANEPWTFGFEPAELPAYLDALGFALLEDVGAAEYRARYMGAAARRLRGYEFYRVALARLR